MYSLHVQRRCQGRGRPNQNRSRCNRCRDFNRAMLAWPWPSLQPAQPAQPAQAWRAECNPRGKIGFWLQHATLEACLVTACSSGLATGQSISAAASIGQKLTSPTLQPWRETLGLGPRKCVQGNEDQPDVRAEGGNEGDQGSELRASDVSQTVAA